MKNGLISTAIFSIGLAYANQCLNDTDTTFTYGVDPACNDFTNNARIDVQDNRGDNENSSPIGVLVNDNPQQPLDSFINYGNILSSGSIGSIVNNTDKISTGIYGFGTYGDRAINTFKNNAGATIKVDVKAGDTGKDRSVINLIGWSSYFGKQTTQVINEGDIESKATAGSAIGNFSWINLSSASLYFKERVEELTNKGTLKSEAYGGSTIGNKSTIDIKSGIASESSIGTLINQGRMDFSAQGQSAQGKCSEYYVRSSIYTKENIGSFKNYGDINISSEGGSATGDRSTLNSWSGIFTGDPDSSTPPNGSFENYGNINIKALALKSEGRDSTLNIQPEIIMHNGINTFKNEGSIRLSAIGEDATGQSSNINVLSGISLKHNPNGSDIDNSGIIEITSKVGSALGEGSKIESYAYGLSGDWVNSMKNSGTIKVSTEAGSAVGDKSSMFLYLKSMKARGSENSILENFGDVDVIAKAGDNVGVSAVGIDSAVTNFKNSGNVKVSVETGSNSTVERVWAVDSSGKGTALSYNSGNLQTTIKAGPGSDIVESGGWIIRRERGMEFYRKVENTGNIFVKVDAPSAGKVDVNGIYLFDMKSDDDPNMSVKSFINRGDITIENNNPNASISGIKVARSKVDSLSNYSFIYFNNSEPTADIRTLRVIDSSDVTLGDKFAILFSQDNVDMSKAPIYVGGNSTLRLNNSTLIVGIRNYNHSQFAFNTCYPLIEKDGTSMVEGEFNSNIEKGYANPNISVEWCNPNQRSGNAQIVFRYLTSPQGSISTPHNTFRLHPFRITSLLIEQVYMERQIPDALTEKFITLKDNYTAYPPHAKATELDRFIFAIPFYTHTDSNGLGYRAYSKGLIAGFSPKPEGNLRYGLYAAYVDSYVKAKDMPAKEDQDTYALGLYTSYLRKPYFVAFDLLGEATKHHYKGLTGFNFEIGEKAKYWSRKIESKLVGGYIFSGDRWSVMPTIGVRAIRWSANGYATQADVPEWSTRVKPERRTWVSGLVELTGGRLIGKSDNLKTSLTGLVRLEHVLTDNYVAVSQGIPALNTGFVRVKKDISKTTLVARSGVEFVYKSRYSLGISGGVWLNSDYKAYDARALFKWMF